MSQVISSSARRPRGLALVARCWKLSRATLYRRRDVSTEAKRRPGPLGPGDDATLLAPIKRAIDAVHRRRLSQNLGTAALGGHPHLARAHPAPDGRAHVFIAVDHCNSECIGIHADRSANRFQALEPIRQGVTRHFGAVAKDIATGLKLRHDHGSNYMSNDFQKEIDFLGIKASPSFVREPEGNGVAERFIRTLKENLLWVRDFETIEELRLALIEFARWYNDNWLVARHRYKTPAQVRENQMAPRDLAA